MNRPDTPHSGKTIVPREKAFRDFEAVLSIGSPEHALVVEADGGLGKTWFLWSLQEACRERDILHNRFLIDFYDTPSQRLSGLMHQIIKELDPDGRYYQEYLDLRREFDAKWQETEGISDDEAPSMQGLGENAETKPKESAGTNWFTQNERAAELNKVFLDCTKKLGSANRTEGSRGVAIFFDTYEMVREGRVGRWLAEEFVPAAQDIVVVVATRPSHDEALISFPEGSVRQCSPGEFLEEEIVQYMLMQVSENPEMGGWALTESDVRKLARLIYQHSGGKPVLVNLVFDIFLYTKKFTFSEMRDILTEAARANSFLDGLVEKLIEILGDDRFNGYADQQWAVLYMAQFRRRFNQEIYAFLQGKSQPDSLCDLSSFKGLWVVKSRERNLATNGNEQTSETSFLLHDIIRDSIHKRYWRGSMPKQMVIRALGAGIFPAELKAKWNEAMSMTTADEIEVDGLACVLDWLDRRIARYYEQEEQDLEAQQPSQDSTAWKYSQVHRQALRVERFLYHLDRDTTHAWRSIRREYDEAFEAYRQGYCELLELMALSAWNEEETANNPEKSAIKDMMRVRQWWWRIRHGTRARQRAIEHLAELLHQKEGTPNLSHELLADINSALGWGNDLDGKLDDAIRYRKEAADLYERQKDLGRDHERVLNFLGLSYAQQGDFKSADDCWEKALTTALKQDPWDNAEIGSIAMKRAYYKGLSGELSPAIGYINLAERHFDRAGDPRRLGMCLAYKARIYLANVRFGHADRALNEAQRLLGWVGDEDDEALWKTARSEFLRRRAVQKIQNLAQGLKGNDPDDTRATIKNDFEDAATYLRDVLEIAQRNDHPTLLGIEALGERGVLFRDHARFLAEQSDVREAEAYWRNARIDLEAALKQSRELSAWFFVANLLDDLCDLYSDQHRLITTNGVSLDLADKSPKELLLAHLEELDKVAQEHKYDRFRSRVAEKRAKLSYENGEYREAIDYTVLACEAVGLHTHSGHMFRNSYDKLVGDLEQRLRDLPTDEERVERSQEAITQWGERRLGAHPQLIIACERVLHPAQARIFEQEADAAFEEHDYASAFREYVEACHRMALRANDTYQNYGEYSKLVAKLERRLYDLDDPKDVESYSDFVKRRWLEYGHFKDHPSVIDVCNRARRMSLIGRADSSDRRTEMSPNSAA